MNRFVVGLFALAISVSASSAFAEPARVCETGNAAFWCAYCSPDQASQNRCLCSNAYSSCVEELRGDTDDQKNTCAKAELYSENLNAVKEIGAQLAIAECENNVDSEIDRLTAKQLLPNDRAKGIADHYYETRKKNGTLLKPAEFSGALDSIDEIVGTRPLDKAKLKKWCANTKYRAIDNGIQCKTHFLPNAMIKCRQKAPPTDAKPECMVLNPTDCDLKDLRLPLMNRVPIASCEPAGGMGAAPQALEMVIRNTRPQGGGCEGDNRQCRKECPSTKPRVVSLDCLESCRDDKRDCRISRGKGKLNEASKALLNATGP